MHGRGIRNTLVSVIFLFFLFIPPSMGSYTIDKEKTDGVAKFSGKGEDFSLDQAIYLCPFDAACGGTKLYEKLTYLRQVREQVLKPTKIGRKYSMIFSKHSYELARLVLENPELAEGARELARLLIPIAADLLEADFTNKNIILDRMDASQIKILSVAFEEKASLELRKEIIEIRFELDDFVDKNVEEIYVFLNGGKITDELLKLKEWLPKNPLGAGPSS